MAGFSESLSIQIMGDSSGFQSELDEVIERLESLNQLLDRLGSSGSAFSRLGADARRMLSPLSQVSSRLQQVVNQVRQLSGMSVSINVSPALAALNQLSAAIARVAAQLASLSGSGGGGRVGGGIPNVPNPGGGNPSGGYSGGGGGRTSGSRQFAGGGLVTGRSGIDRIPAMLTAGEFVVQKAVVSQLGLAPLEDVNRGVERNSNRNPSEQPSGSQTIHQYGEISVHVNEMADVSGLLSDLQLEGHRLRNRRG
ncbi:hypothetical protein [Rubinisphaera italica]|uniref:Uncharacterized protein n=1 Tax=Rubinisphaera italica TaxID=2527969 RepID=A0A5C5XKY6_9PLAN|nr:hypothetical protein [Rubinisphaera italica]TWT63209.1 hypothetical protein Pan54_39620 [Rubinisphaera italica]